MQIYFFFFFNVVVQTFLAVVKLLSFALQWVLAYKAFNSEQENQLIYFQT